jgi:hypothetical protein
MDIKVKNGTPLHGPSLCETCERAHIVKGYRQSEIVVVCRATYEPQMRITFPVRECSSYVEHGRKNLADMDEIAWTLVPRGPKRAAGFFSPATSTGDEREIEIVLKKNQ